MATPHLDKLNAALSNPKARDDVPLLQTAREAYRKWIADLNALDKTRKDRVIDMVKLLNEYKNTLEVDLILKRGSAFLKRQKGQLKLDNSVLEEFLIHLVHPAVVQGLDLSQFTSGPLVTGPQNAFMSLSFRPRSLGSLNEKPEAVLKSKDQDFVLGARIHYKLAPGSSFLASNTATGAFVLAVMSAECKVNLDKTMFQEACGTATRLKQGCPVAKYFMVVEFLDMEPEDTRLTDVDNVFLLRHAKRLPSQKRDKVPEVEAQRAAHPIDAEVVWRFVQEIQAFVDVAWYDPQAVLRRGSFV